MSIEVNPFESMCRYYETLMEKGQELSNKDKQHYNRCQRILAVAMGISLAELQHIRNHGFDPLDTQRFNPVELEEV